MVDSGSGADTVDQYVRIGEWMYLNILNRFYVDVWHDLGWYIYVHQRKNIYGVYYHDVKAWGYQECCGKFTVVKGFGIAESQTLTDNKFERRGCNGKTMEKI